MAKYKAIIVAAGMGQRLHPLTNHSPKCLLEINGATILERSVSALRSCGVSDIVVVRGYEGNMIDLPALRYYENVDFENNNILESLFCARAEMEGKFLFSYSDILFSVGVVKRVLNNPADFAIVVDTNWREHYVGRTQHPITEAELVAVSNGLVAKIGKDVVVPCEAYGEFIGLAKFSKKGAEILKDVYSCVSVEFDKKRFHQAATIHKAYLTDMIQELIDRGYGVSSVDIAGEWQEIDTPQDLERAQILWRE